MIANTESGGDPTSESRVDKCTSFDGASKVSVSIGLFQINITAHKLQAGQLNCPAAFDRRYDGPSTQCRVINQQLYFQCVQAAKISSINIARACEISGNGQNWSAWSATARKCGF